MRLDLGANRLRPDIGDIRMSEETRQRIEIDISKWNADDDETRPDCHCPSCESHRRSA